MKKIVFLVITVASVASMNANPFKKAVAGYIGINAAMFATLKLMTYTQANKQSNDTSQVSKKQWGPQVKSWAR